jgi:Tol biopolymer transport system component
MDFLPLSARRLAPVAAAICALAVPPTSQAFSGTNGPVVFDRGGSIFSGTTALSQSGYDFAPTVSPDGSQVAYAVNRDIWVMDADGSDAHQVTTNVEWNRDPAWSPDGKRLAFAAAGAGGRSDIFAVPATGGTAKNLSQTEDHDESDPGYSPDGTRIAYTRTGCDVPYGGGTCVYVMSATGAGQTNLTPENHVPFPGCQNSPGYFFNGSSDDPTWSPDGTKIAFSGPLDCNVSTLGSDIWVMGADGSGKTDLTHDDATNDVEPAFSPDGTQIAFARNSHGGPTNIHVLSGTAVTQVSTGGDDRNPDWGVAPKHCVVPKLKKRTLPDAKADLALMGCRAGKVSKRKTKAAKGTIVGQAEKAGSRLRPGTRIDLVVDK